jgi:hypothetical protein
LFFHADDSGDIGPIKLPDSGLAHSDLAETRHPRDWTCGKGSLREANLEAATQVALVKNSLLEDESFCSTGRAFFRHRNVARVPKKWNHRAKRWFHFQVPLQGILIEPYL